MDDNGDTFSDLYLDDLVHANAISSLKILERQDMRDINGQVLGMLERGLYDAEEVEGSVDRGLSKVMRYSASIGTQLLSHLVDHSSSVRCPLTSSDLLDN